LCSGDRQQQQPPARPAPAMRLRWLRVNVERVQTCDAFPHVDEVKCTASKSGMPVIVFVIRIGIGHGASCSGALWQVAGPGLQPGSAAHESWVYSLLLSKSAMARI
jgi:hypothetical protein